MVLKMKVEAVNFRKSQEISLLWLDCFTTKFRNKRRGGANRSPPGPNRVKKIRLEIGFIEKMRTICGIKKVL